jgi:GDP-mannose 6-dehydrogenase
VADLYRPLGAETCIVSLRTAEMIKYACNTFHALKVTFANEIGTLCASLGVSGAEVMETLCQDVKLNTSAAYLRPGFAFGGSCLPKDLRALVYRASRMDLKLPLLETILPSNDQHLKRAIQKVLDLPVERLGVFGLAFKENTDDLRESPVVSLLEQLIGKGRNVRVFDPHIRVDEIYGSNRRFVLAAIPHIGNLFDINLETMVEWAEYVVITQQPAPAFAELICASGRPLLDLSGMSQAIGESNKVVPQKP